MKRLCILILLTVAVETLSAQVNYTARTDKNVYHYGDQIFLTLTATNTGIVPDTLSFPTSCQATYHIDTLNYLQHDSVQVQCEQVFTYRVIAPQESTTWGGTLDPSWGFPVRQPELAVGEHAVVGQVIGYWTSDSLRITVANPTGVRDEAAPPHEYVLSDNYPNPFNPTTTIRFALPRGSFVTLKVFNLLGMELATLVENELGAGTYTARWDAGSYPSGLYFYRLKAGPFVATKKFLLLR
jgi:hypothetical protein